MSRSEWTNSRITTHVDTIVIAKTLEIARTPCRGCASFVQSPTSQKGLKISLCTLVEHLCVDKSDLLHPTISSEKVNLHFQFRTGELGLKNRVDPDIQHELVRFVLSRQHGTTVLTAPFWDRLSGQLKSKEFPSARSFCQLLYQSNGPGNVELPSPVFIP